MDSWTWKNQRTTFCNLRSSSFPCHAAYYVNLICAMIFVVLSLSSYTEEKFDGQIPRWNFNDFGQACMMIFRILCGEWIEPLYDSMRATSPASFLFFLTALVIGNFLVSSWIRWFNTFLFIDSEKAGVLYKCSLVVKHSSLLWFLVSTSTCTFYCLYCFHSRDRQPYRFRETKESLA